MNYWGGMPRDGSQPTRDTAAMADTASRRRPGHFVVYVGEALPAVHGSLLAVRLRVRALALLGVGSTVYRQWDGAWLPVSRWDVLGNRREI
jgi:hypothetical protein